MTQTLDAARDWLRDRVDDGEECPCCRQFAKVYKRKLNAGMARVLIAMYRKAGTDWTYLPHVDLKDGEKRRTVGHSGEMCMTRYWGLIEAYPDTKREDGSSRVGWWRLTPLGVEFVLGRTQVPKYARVYSSRCLGLTGDPVSITDALGTKFNYADLMAGV
ncbi:hypothetical protein [Mycolicibacterium sphagni]|uniref:Uncharacterized protein n=1 Tax=Mycolicibacterium sphagni TaxID=1786 RepID=A0A255DRK4_9MYCO|nr:hypothetical protein [Mycolicibacterium sphagni]OYN81720.1 hypothetical protein CG716_05025 [Mycolicibacterium sphagni]